MNNRESFKLNPSDCIYMLEAPLGKEATVIDFRGMSEEQLQNRIGRIRDSYSQKQQEESLRRQSSKQSPSGKGGFLDRLLSVWQSFFHSGIEVEKIFLPPPAWLILICRQDQLSRIAPLRKTPATLTVITTRSMEFPEGRMFEMRPIRKSFQRKALPETSANCSELHSSRRCASGTIQQGS